MRSTDVLYKSSVFTISNFIVMSEKKSKIDFCTSDFREMEIYSTNI